MIPLAQQRDLIEDLIRTTRGTKFTRVTQHRPFAICIAQHKRDELIIAMQQYQRLSGRPIDTFRPREVRVNGALIGTIACN